MSDMSTFAGQAEHYAAVRARLTNVAAPLPRAPRPPRRMYLLPKVRMNLPVGFGVPINLLAPAAAHNIIRLVALRRDVNLDDILGPRRDRHLVAARYEAIRLVKSHCPHLSYPGIGRVFNRDHTSILNALGRVKKNKKSTAA